MNLRNNNIFKVIYTLTINNKMRFLTKLGILLVLLSLGLHYFVLDSSVTTKDVIDNPLSTNGLLGLVVFFSMVIGGILLLIAIFGRKKAPILTTRQ